MAISWEYIAGFFDGEGNINIPLGAGRLSARISIHQSAARGERLLSSIAEFLLARGIKCGTQLKQITPNSNVPCYRLYIYNRDGVIRFIRGVYPFLHIKKLECQDYLRYMMLYPAISNTTACWGTSHKKTHCRRGHEMRPDNLYYGTKAGKESRMCKTCALQRANDSYARRIKIDRKVEGWL